MHRKWQTLAAVLTLAFAVATAAAASKHATVLAEPNTTSFTPGQQAVIAVVVDFEEGFHSQSHTPSQKNFIPLEVTLSPAPGVTAFAPIYPSGQDKDYPAPLNHLNIYSGRTIIYVPMQIKSDAPPGPVKLSGSVHLQICNDSQCFIPQRIAFSINTTIVAPGEPPVANSPELFKGFDPKIFSRLLANTTPPVPVAPQAAAPNARDSQAGSFVVFGYAIRQDAYLPAFAAAILIGIIFNLMPCVLPVLPLKAIGFYEVSQHNRAKSFSFGIVFSIGIVATFAVLALIVLLGHKNWGQLYSKGWFVWSMSAILIIMALGMFGLFTFSLPVGVYRIEPRHDTYVGNFLFGILTALLSTPCTAPIFPGLLIWAAAAPKSVGVGAIMMVGVGMALPYLVLSAMPELARKLPRTGPWSEIVKQSMAFLLLAVAGYLIGQRLLAGTQYMWIVLALTIAGGIFLVVRTWQLMRRIDPVFIASLIAVVFIAAVLGLTLKLQVGHKTAAHGGLAWQDYSDAAMARSRSGNVVVIDFTANWCANCQYVDATVFEDPRAREALRQSHVVLLRADLTREEAPGWNLLNKLNPAGGIPLTAIYAPGSESPIQLTSIYRTQNLLDALHKAESPPISQATMPSAEAR